MSEQKAKKKMKPAARFLLIIAVLAGLFIVVAIGFGIWANSNPTRMLQIAFTPGHPFEAQKLEQLNYSSDENWAALPTKASHASAKPEGIVDIAVIPEADVFFVHPTTLLDKSQWNDLKLDNPEAKDRIANRVLKIQASAFNTAGRIFAPRYRQATFGAFLDEEDNGLKAIGLAYGDIVAAFDNFIAERNDGRPFILAGHSQGSLHLLYLLQQRINGTALAHRMVAAYIIGWPVSIEADLSALADIKACERANETGCVVSFQTFGLGGDPSGILTYMNTTPGLSGAPRKGTQVLCTNPQDWLIGSNKTRSAHLGAVMLPAGNDKPLGKPIKNFTGTQCGTDGILYITDLPGDAWQALKMHGENYHVYDYHMFYMNIRENAAMRTQAWLKNNAAGATSR